MVKTMSDSMINLLIAVVAAGFIFGAVWEDQP
jgi:hypothetical protein